MMRPPYITDLSCAHADLVGCRSLRDPGDALREWPAPPLPIDPGAPTDAQGLRAPRRSGPVDLVAKFLLAWALIVQRGGSQAVASGNQPGESMQ